MKMKFVALLAISFWVVALSGCVRTVDGRREAGVPFSKDKIVRIYERPVLQVWAATKDVLSANGTIFSEDVMQSTVSARVDTRTVRVKVESLDERTTRVTVQTRTRAGRGDIDLGGEIDKQIAIRLATGTLSPAPAPGAR